MNLYYIGLSIMELKLQKNKIPFNHPVTTHIRFNSHRYLWY